MTTSPLLLEFGETVQRDLQNGELTLNGSSLIPEGIINDWQQAFDARFLQLKEASVSQTNGQVRIHGVLPSLLNLTDLAVDIIVFARRNASSDTEELECLIAASLPDSWTFPQSYPDMPGYINFSPESAGQGRQPSFFNALPTDNPKLLYSSYDYHSNDDATVPFPPSGYEKTEIRRGVNFATEIDLEGPLALLKTFINSPSTLPLHGYIEETALDEQVSLWAALPAEVTLGPITFQLSHLGLYSSLSTRTAMPTSGLRLPGYVEIGTGSNKVTMDLTASIAIGGTVIGLEGEFDNLRLPQLEDMAALLGGENLASNLPVSLDQFGDLSLRATEITASLSNLQILAAYLHLQAASGWTIVPDVFSIEDVDLEWYVQDPFGTRSMTFRISGTLSLGSANIIVSAQFPDFFMYGQLAPGSTVYLSDILSALSFDIEELSRLALLDLELCALPKQKNFAFSMLIANDWALDLGNTACTISQIALDAAYDNGDVSGTLQGLLEIGSHHISVGADLQQQLTLNAVIPFLNLTAIVEQFFPDDIVLPNEVPDFEFSNVELSITPATGEFSLSAASANEWDLPVGVDGLSISGVTINVNRVKKTDGTKAVTGSIGGALHIGSASFTVAYTFPGGFVLTGNLPSFSLSPLVQELCGGDLVRDLPVPVGVLNVAFTDVNVSIAPRAPSFSLAGTSSYGQTELIIKKVGTQWGLGVGFVPPPDWQFSNIDDALAGLDGLSFSDTTLIVSSSDDASFALTTIQPGGAAKTVGRGLNFYADLDLSGLGVDELTGLTSLAVYAAIGPRPADLAIGATVEGTFALADNVTFGNVVFELSPAPTAFSLRLLGDLSVVLDDNPLRFVGGLVFTITPALTAGITATMEGSWVEPFDVKGVIVSDVALDLGLRFGPIVPTIGIAGSLVLGSGKDTVTGSAAVKFDAANPGKSMIAVGFNRLFLNEVINAFCQPGLARAIPRSLSQTVLNMSMEDVDVYIVPQPTQIGTLKYEQGLTVQGTTRFWGVSSALYANIDYTKGIVVEGEIDPVSAAGGAFELTGAGGKPKAAIDLNLLQGQPFYFNINGAVSLLGLKREAEITITDGGFAFTISGKIFDLFEATLTASGSDPTKGRSFMIAATMKNDLIEYLQDKASEAIEEAAKGAMAEISKAQRTLNRAQNDVDSLDRQIKNMKSKIQKERDRDTKNLRDAQKEVDSVQNKVNSLNRQIKSKKNKIDDLNKKIKKKKKWYNKSNAFQKSYRWAEYSAYAATKGTEITALYTAIGGLEASKKTAQGVLEVAKQSLRGMEAAAEAVPIDMDPRMIALYSSKETADLALEAAKGSLDALKKSIGAVADVGQFIVEKGLGGLIDIKKASFSASLNAVKGGRVSMSLTLKFMNKRQQTLSLSFNFHDPLSSAQDLAQRLLPA